MKFWKTLKYYLLQKVLFIRNKYRTLQRTIGMIRAKIRYFFVEYKVAKKSKWLLSKAIDVTFTGSLIWYAVTYQNPISYGLIAVLSVYYFEWIVKTIKG